MNTKLKLISLALFSLTCGAANAISVSTVQTSTGLFTNKSGVCTVDFNTPGSVSSCLGTTYTAANGIASHIVSGDLGGQYAQPMNDPTPYLTLGPSAGSPVVINLATGANYFGFYAGSIDFYNSIMFSGANGAVTLTGTQINSYVSTGIANGSQSAYFNIFTDSLFTTITLMSSQNAFETDNHAFGIAAPSAVPAPESTALLGLGALALLAARRRKN